MLLLFKTLLEFAFRNALHCSCYMSDNQNHKENGHTCIGIYKNFKVTDVEMLNDFLVTKLKNFAGYNQRTWFQQDGATSNTSNLFRLRVGEILPQKLISRRRDKLASPQA